MNAKCRKTGTQIKPSEKQAMTRALVPIVGANSRPLGASHWDTSNGEYGSFYRKKRAREVFRKDVDEPSVTVDEQPLAGAVLMPQPTQQVCVIPG